MPVTTPQLNLERENRISWFPVQPLHGAVPTSDVRVLQGKMAKGVVLLLHKPCSKVPRSSETLSEDI